MEPSKMIVVGLLLIAIGVFVTGRLFLFFKVENFGGIPEIEAVLNKVFSIPVMGRVFGLLDLLQLLGLLLFLWGVKWT